MNDLVYLGLIKFKIEKVDSHAQVVLNTLKILPGTKPSIGFKFKLTLFKMKEH